MVSKGIDPYHTLKNTSLLRQWKRWATCTHVVTHPITGSKHKTTSSGMGPRDSQGFGVSRSSSRNSQWCSQWYLLNVRAEQLLVSPRGGGITEKCTLQQFGVGHLACGAGVGQGGCQHQWRGRVSECRVSISFQYFCISTSSKYKYFQKSSTETTK